MDDQISRLQAYIKMLEKEEQTKDIIKELTFRREQLNKIKEAK